MTDYNSVVSRTEVLFRFFIPVRCLVHVSLAGLSLQTQSLNIPDVSLETSSFSHFLTLLGPYCIQ